MKRYESETICVEAYKRGGYYILRIRQYNNFYVATKHSRKAHIESGWTSPYEKKFEEKEQANKYFKAIKMRNPDMQLVMNEPNQYISYDGTIKHY